MDKSVVLKEWKEAQAHIESMKELRADRFFRGVPNIQRAFSGNTSLTCGDEGIRHGIHAPGAGVLLSEDKFEKLIKDAQITELTSHDSCGAFAAAFPKIPPAERNEACRGWVAERALQYDLEYRHIAAHEMQRPQDFHHATVIYYDGTGKFNHIEGLPPGFVLSRRYSAAMDKELELYLGIALGPTGFGALFTSTKPFRIIAMGHPDPVQKELSVEQLTKEIKTIVRPFGSRVVIDGVKTSWIFGQIVSQAAV